jgi:hypothetical protein
MILESKGYHPPVGRFDLIWFIVLSATFRNISATSWRPSLVVEDLQGRARIHAVLVICLYELLDNPTTYLIESAGPFPRGQCFDTDTVYYIDLFLKFIVPK